MYNSWSDSIIYYIYLPFLQNSITGLRKQKMHNYQTDKLHTQKPCIALNKWITLLGAFTDECVFQITVKFGYAQQNLSIVFTLRFATIKFTRYANPTPNVDKNNKP